MHRTTLFRRVVTGAMAKVVSAYDNGQGGTDKIHVAMTLLSRSDTFAKEATLMGTRSSDFDVYFTSSYLVAQHAPYLQPLDVSNNFLYHRTDLVGRLASDPSWKSAYEKISSQVVGRRLEPKKPGDKHRTHVHALAVAINKFGKNQTAAEKWLAYLATPAAMTTYAKAGGIPAQPAVPSSLTGTNPIFKYVAHD